jgi:hypothetical protein
MSREPSVSVAGDGDASVPMEPYQWPAAYQQPSVRCGALNYCKLYHYADGAVPMDQQPSMSREVSVFLVSMASDLSAAVYEP